MKSPCVEVCRFDGTGRWIACGRTLAERRAWKKAFRQRLPAMGAELPRPTKLAARGMAAESAR